MAPKRRLATRRLALRRRPAAASKPEAGAVKHVVSLGSICLTARFLEGQGVRAYKGPFDWLYTSPRMVRHCLTDDFRKYLDKRQYVFDKFDKKRGTGHKLYNRMQLGQRERMWPHHNLHRADGEDAASFKRAVERFRVVLKDGAHLKLFALCQSVSSSDALAVARQLGPERLPDEEEVPIPSKNGVHLGSFEEVRRLFRCLCSKVSGPFVLQSVLLVAPPASEATRTPVLKSVCSETHGSGKLLMSELHCLGRNTGLFFKNQQDVLALHRAMVKGRSFAPASVDDSVAVGMTDDKRSDRGVKRSSVGEAKPRHQQVNPRLGSSWSMKGGVARKLKYQQQNPKAPGSTAHVRYEKYKRARSVGEFFALGGKGGDLRFDSARGWVEFR